jgi:hypothetical protein
MSSSCRGGGGGDGDDKQGFIIGQGYIKGREGGREGGTLLWRMPSMVTMGSTLPFCGDTTALPFSGKLR